MKGLLWGYLVRWRRRRASVFDLLEPWRERGWCVTMKALPPWLAFTIQGSRSEYDAPCPDQQVGQGLWACEAQWVGRPDLDPFRYEPAEFAMAKTPEAAVREVVRRLEGRKPRRNFLAYRQETTWAERPGGDA